MNRGQIWSLLTALFGKMNAATTSKRDSLPSLLVEPVLETAQGLPLTPRRDEGHMVTWPESQTDFNLLSNHLNRLEDRKLEAHVKVQ